MPGPYRVFFSAPMSALEGDAHQPVHNQTARALFLELSKSHKPVYFAGANSAVSPSFTSPSDALEADLRALHEAAVLVLFYPARVATSALVEVGFALARRRPCLLIVYQAEDLPWLLRGKPDGAWARRHLPEIETLVLHRDAPGHEIRMLLGRSSVLRATEGSHGTQ